MTGRLDKKVVLISGAARGQGAAAAKLFVAEGARVILGDVLVDEAKAVAAPLGDRAEVVKLDVTSEQDWRHAISAAEAMSRLDVLVNNAGALRIRPLEHETVDGLRSMLDVNLIGAFLGMRAALPLMRTGGGGSIINVASTSALSGMPYMGAYGSSKWALRGLTRTAAVEWGRFGVRVNAIFPGPIDTDMLPAAKAGSEEPRFAHLPLGRAGAPEEVAQLALFLASDESSYVAGGEFTIDGGSMAGSTPGYEWKPE